MITLFAALFENKNLEPELLLEPDEAEPEEEEQREMSVAGGIAGFTLPLGKSPDNYNRKSFIKTTKAAFGGNK
jgi:hypothetical protein